MLARGILGGAVPADRWSRFKNRPGMGLRCRGARLSKPYRLPIRPNFMSDGSYPQLRTYPISTPAQSKRLPEAPLGA